MSVMTMLLILLPLVFGRPRLFETTAAKQVPETKRVRCPNKRCCQYKSESDNSVNCLSLTIEECVLNDDHCVWDCEGPKKGKRKKKKTFYKFDEGLGIPHEPDWANEELKPQGHKPETVEDMQEMSSWLIYDKECGDVYKVDIDESTASDRLLQQEHRHQMSVGDYPPDSDKDGHRDDPDGTRRRMPILGPDGRTQIMATTFPYTTAVLIIYDKPDGLTYRCSGTMISLKTVITAAHCIYDLETDQFGSNYRVLVGSDEYTDTFGTWIPWSSATVPYDWAIKSTYSAEYDIGVIRLAQYPGVGYMGFGYDSSLTIPTSMNTFGYPSDKTYGTLWFQYCPYDYQISYYKFTSTECDSAGGQSGSCKYIYWSTGTRTIYAIHSGGIEGYFSWAARINPSLFGMICDFIEDGGEIYRCSSCQS